ncbi:MAG: homoserine kinase [Chitinophagaceae bacterium]|nr:homoserine kinase [Chitinophagaceae bacterium]MCZ2395905.1 homoserine kinase [Chitinophagales bacterium]
MNEVKLRVPATIANIVCGFDVLGFAVSAPYDEITLKLSEKPGIRIHHTDNFELPEDPVLNVAGVSLQALLNETGSAIGFDVEIQKNIKPGSGLGSSAASAMGAVAAANMVLGNPFTKSQLLYFAMQGEKVAGGVAHLDNVAPCLLGGVSIIQSLQPPDAVSIPAPELHVSIIHPQIEVKTSDSRKIIRKEVPLKSAIIQWSNVASLVAGFCTGNYTLIGKSLHDVIFEPSRSILIPGFEEVKSRCLAAGALGGGIAGSGPSMFMFSREKDTAEKVVREMTTVYQNLGVDYKTYVTTLKQTPLI